VGGKKEDGEKMKMKIKNQRSEREEDEENLEQQRKGLKNEPSHPTQRNTVPRTTWEI